MTVSADTATYLLIALGRVSLKHFPAFGKSPARLKRWGRDLQLLLDGPELWAVVPPLLLTSFMATSSWRSLNLHLAIWELLHSSTPTFLQLRDSMDSCSCWVLVDEHQNHRWNVKKPNKESTIWKRRPILFQLRYKRTIFPSQVRQLLSPVLPSPPSTAGSSGSLGACQHQLLKPWLAWHPSVLFKVQALHPALQHFS